MRDRPDEIDVTPAMIEAGVTALHDALDDYLPNAWARSEAVVLGIFEAMARRSGPCSHGR